MLPPGRVGGVCYLRYLPTGQIWDAKWSGKEKPRRKDISWDLHRQHMFRSVQQIALRVRRAPSFPTTVSAQISRAPASLRTKATNTKQLKSHRAVDEANSFFANNPLTGVFIAFGIATPFAYLFLREDHGVYIPEGADHRDNAQHEKEIALEKERMSLYKHLIDDPVVSRRKEIASMDKQAKQAMILSHAMTQGLGSAVQWGFLTGAAVLGAVSFSPLFRKSTGISSRLAPVVIMTFGSFMLANELEISEATKVGSDQYVESKRIYFALIILVHPDLQLI